MGGDGGSWGRTGGEGEGEVEEEYEEVVPPSLGHCYRIFVSS